ncbi:MAG: hypothetical protein Tsb002_35530 [Wenzhouxiangellaceae bacterium]
MLLFAIVFYWRQSAVRNFAGQADAPAEQDSSAEAESLGLGMGDEKVYGQESERENTSQSTDIALAFEQSNNLQNFLYEMEIQSASGVGEASRYIYKALEECLHYTAIPDVYYDDQRAHVSAFESTASKQIAMHLLERAEARCTSLYPRDPITHDEMTEWLKLAANQGDLVAQVMLASRVVSGEIDNVVMDDSTVKHIIIKALTSKQPEAIYEVAGFMSIPVLGRDALRSHYAGGQEHYVAWALAACDLGYPCSRGSPVMNKACLTLGACQYGSLEQYFYDQVIPPAQVSQIQRLRNEINMMFRDDDFEGVFIDG